MSRIDSEIQIRKWGSKIEVRDETNKFRPDEEDREDGKSYMQIELENLVQADFEEKRGVRYIRVDPSKLEKLKDYLMENGVKRVKNSEDIRRETHADYTELKDLTIENISDKY